MFIFAKHHQESQNKMHLVTLGNQGDKAAAVPVSPSVTAHTPIVMLSASKTTKTHTQEKKSTKSILRSVSCMRDTVTKVIWFKSSGSLREDYLFLNITPLVFFFDPWKIINKVSTTA